MICCNNLTKDQEVILLIYTFCSIECLKKYFTLAQLRQLYLIQSRL